MKSRDTLIRLKKFQVDEKRRKVAQIESMIADFDRMAFDLEREIRVEQERAGISDPTHFAYPTYAKAAIQRRENIKRSGDELKVQLDAAKNALTDAFDSELTDDVQTEFSSFYRTVASWLRFVFQFKIQAILAATFFAVVAAVVLPLKKVRTE